MSCPACHHGRTVMATNPPGRSTWAAPCSRVPMASRRPVRPTWAKLAGSVEYRSCSLRTPRSGRGGDPSVQRRPVGRGGKDQGDEPAHGRVDQTGDRSAVTADDLAVPGGALALGESEVGLSEVGPLGLVLDADGVAALVDGFDKGGADPAHRVDHGVAGLGVGGDRPGRDGGQHLGRVDAGDVEVPPGALGPGRSLGGGPDRQWQLSGHRRTPCGTRGSPRAW